MPDKEDFCENERTNKINIPKFVSKLLREWIFVWDFVTIFDGFFVIVVVSGRISLFGVPLLLSLVVVFFVIASFNALALCVWAWHRITTANALAKPIQLYFNFFVVFFSLVLDKSALLFRYEYFAKYQNDRTHTVTFSAIFVVQISLLCRTIVVWTILSLTAHKHISPCALQLCLCVFWFY